MTMKWQPIETAPIEVKVLILTNIGIFQAIKRGVNWIASDSTKKGRFWVVAEEKTHWMPLPEAPKKETN